MHIHLVDEWICIWYHPVQEKSLIQNISTHTEMILNEGDSR